MIQAMNKKTYIKPAIETVDIETVEMIATSYFEFEEEGGEEESLVVVKRPERRGKWGDLWYVEEVVE